MIKHDWNTTRHGWGVILRDGSKWVAWVAGDTWEVWAIDPRSTDAAPVKRGYTSTHAARCGVAWLSRRVLEEGAHGG